MSIDITVRWGGPSDATASSTYKVERTLNYTDWSELAASQAATSPYVSPVNTISGDADYGDATLDLTDGTDFSSSGYGWLDEEALVEWTGKSTNQLTGVLWHSGYGTYTSGSTFVEAHETYSDNGVDPTANAVAYRITHTDASSKVSAPAYLWYYYPPAPVSSGHCVVIVSIGADLGISRQSSVTVTCRLTTDTQYDDAYGAHLDQSGAGSENSQTSNAMGIAHFHCWKNSARASSAGTDSPYEFVLGTDFTVYVSTIPDRDWVLLSQVADA